jgi:pyridoxal phosphate enzyme (YggS family)
LLSAETHDLLAANLGEVQTRIAAACAKFERDPSEVTLVAVTKTVVPEVARALTKLGPVDLGENRLPVFDAKLQAFEAQPAGPAPTWHFIGKIQGNKARRVVERAAVIHSVDSLKLLRTIGRVAAELGKKPTLYLQVKHATLGGDTAKTGMLPSELKQATALAAELTKAGHISLAGLMAMAPLGLDPSIQREAAAETFALHANLAASLDPGLFEGGTPRLSMGMTGDLEEAIAAGSTCVRVGSALFRGLAPELRNAPPAPIAPPTAP